MENDSVKERVLNMSVRSFNIGSCPEKTYQDFVKFCEENARNVRYFEDKDGTVHEKVEIIYHVGLRLLIDAFKADAKTMMLYNEIDELKSRVGVLESSSAPKKTEQRKTFGGN